jgi:hypothetical protein
LFCQTETIAAAAVQNRIGNEAPPRRARRASRGAIDLDAATITVRLSTSYALGKVTEKAPKSGRSRIGSLSLLEFDALRARKACQQQDRLAAGPAFVSRGPAFADEIGARLRPGL